MSDRKAVITFLFFTISGFLLGNIYPRIRENIAINSLPDEKKELSNNLSNAKDLGKKYSSKNNIDFSIKYSNIYIRVRIYGMVENPGFYRLKKGSTLKDLLSLAKVKSGAYVGNDSDRVLKDNEFIYIKEAINVCLETEKKECYVLPKGSRLYDLLDIAKIDRKSVNMPNYYLKNGQTFFIFKNNRTKEN